MMVPKQIAPYIKFHAQSVSEIPLNEMKIYAIRNLSYILVLCGIILLTRKL
jgi:hypothetical protein